ncbi:PAS domain S-box-containing protein/diguanylate cyclase (GGDEF) domain-containing protein [Terribacillus aidingensis]|uniref:PAS domain S-box-containing protein/diguanylate cyclase (GGDEF) domain-containing protein n=1 Tax=Terribacillus aidingensis TaxID=586416 RepID=A0A285N1L7_9BACI|nr:DUF4084 domain-containing protein [Terribacillus aidingensis]SNZ03364.1 PAS domain S-box-containing protein/diguanylate cyclase (GGDEF) domain-containing protein [Terribacillus aidingensis]
MLHPSYKQLPFVFIFSYMLVYYTWITLFQHHDVWLTWGGNLLCLIACFVAAFWLQKTALSETDKTLRLFWLLLTAAMYCAFLAEFVWMIIENILGKAIPVPGLPDIFYILQYLLYLAAFFYKIMIDRKNNHSTSFLFDVLIILTVASTFSWHFLIVPMLTTGDVSSLALGVSLIYPVGDLALLFGAFVLFYSPQQIGSRHVITIIFVGLQIQVISDTLYLYLVSNDSYYSGNWIDPLIMLANLLIGYAGLLHRQNTLQHHSKTENYITQKNWSHLLYPYISVTILFAFMMQHSSKFDAITVGSGLSILLVISRQLIIIRENQKLVQEISVKAEAIETNEQRYKSLFKHHPDSVFSLDLNGRIEDTNEAGVDLLGYSQEELIGATSDTFAEPAHKTTVRKHIAQMKEGVPLSYEFGVHSKSGSYHYISMTNIPILVRNKLVGIFGIGKDITLNKQNEEKIHYLAYHDPLTGLANRSLFEASLKKAITDQAQSFALMFLDLDDFKKVNDTAGHRIGDKLLMSVADRLKACVRESDIVARNGGDEFTILLQPLKSPEEADNMAADILAALREKHIVDGHILYNMPSIGVAIHPQDGLTISELMNSADQAMYEVKLNGKGSYKFYNS